MTYQYLAMWDRVLPDGLAFCHWGGRRLSRYVFGKLQPIPQTTLDLCCGRGGSLSLIGGGHGIDIDAVAIADACRVSPQASFVTGDAFALPYGDACFTHCYSQDPDILLSHRFPAAIREAQRVLVSGGRFALQCYARSDDATGSMLDSATQTLAASGYQGIPRTLLDISSALQQWFTITECVDLHTVYAEDTRRMLRQSAGSSLEPLFALEQELFARRNWTGTLFLATKQ